MAWSALAFAIAFEIGGTLGLKSTHGFTRPIPTVLVLAAYGISFWLLSVALRTIEVGVAYAIWSAVGTAFIAAVGMALFAETVNLVKILSLVLIIVGVIGLNLAGAG